MSGETLILLWVLVAVAFALGWGVRHWLHRRERDASSEETTESTEASGKGNVVDLRDVDLRDEVEAHNSREGDGGEA